MLKRDELSDPKSCLNKASDDEPLFVIRAKDPMASRVVAFWAEQARGVHEDDKVDRAQREADEMRDWYAENVPS